MSQVVISELTYRYPDRELPALTDVSLEIDAGEFVVVAGVSGSGKSTLLRAINGLAPHFFGGAVAGHVSIGGLDTRAHGPGDLSAHVGSLFQDPEAQVVMGTVRAELAFGLENRGWPAAAVGRAVEEAALALAVDALLDRSTEQLSGGELQRVALGATLAGGVEVVCLDEPTSQLDPVAGDELIALLRRLNEDQDLTVILAEHRLERCLPAADRVIAMVDGGVAFDGEPPRFLEWALTAAPALVTPGARLLAGAGLAPRPGVKAARAALRMAELLPEAGIECAEEEPEPAAKVRRRRLGWAGSESEPALRLDRVWHELKDGPAILRGLSLTLHPGERVALMGRNGAGKSTLLRHAAGLMEPTRGRVTSAGRVALVLQNPTDYLVHETVADEASAAALRRFGLEGLTGHHPRDISGGEKQRLALAVVLGDGVQTPEPAVLCLDEPTRGMDRAVKAELATILRDSASAVLVATHDPEFAAAFARRVVLMGQGVVVADGSASSLLSGGAYFATETARILGGAGGILLPEEGSALLRAQRVPV